MPHSRWVGPTHAGAGERPILPYMRAARMTVAMSRTSETDASHAFMFNVPLNHSVNSPWPAGSCSRP